MEPNVRCNLNFIGSRGNCILSLLLRVVATTVLIGLGAHAARAQPATGQPAPLPNPLAGIEFLVMPYAWTPWVGTGVNPSDTRIPSASGTVGFGKLADHMSWVPFMGAVEVRDGPF